MRTIFTTTDVRNIMTSIFNGNLMATQKNPNIPYVNENSENILLVDENGAKTEIDLAKYLNIDFYSWKERVVSVDNEMSNFETWLESLNYSMNKSYALVELLGGEVTPSQDIDSATLSGKITFLIQTDKVNNLDYYVSKIRNNFLGNPQDIQNSNGDTIKAYIGFNILDYDTEPTTLQYGECIIVSLRFKISYLTDALNYNDTPMEISLDNGANFYQIPYTKSTWQNIFTGQTLTKQTNITRTGLVNSNMVQVKTFTFYDFNKPLTLAINDLFWSLACVERDGVPFENANANIPVIIKVTSNGHTYTFRDVIKNMQKDFTNSDFTISSITLQGYAIGG